MKKFVICFLLATASMLSGQQANAAINISTLVTPGSSTVSANAGDLITADIFMQLTESSDVAAYNFAVRYDQNELTYVSRQEFQFGNLDFQNPNNPAGVGGFVRNIDGATFAPTGTFAPFGPIRIASLVFSANNPIGDLSDIDILPGIWDPLEDAFFSSNFQDVTFSANFSGASVTASAVPEPSSFALAVAAGAGAYLRRRRKNKVANQPQA